MGLSSHYSSTNFRRLLFAMLGFAIVYTTAAHAQSSDAPSLGDLVRKQKQQQQEAKDKGAKPKKVVTDEDIPSHPEESSTEASADDDRPHADAEVTPAGTVMQTGEKWKAAISQQKNAIADLKSRIEKVQSSIHFVEANAYRNGVQYNKVQARKQEEVARAQNQLAEMQKNLEKMQEDARRAGFGSAVWDP
jgi:hypothetical protein